MGEAQKMMIEFPSFFHFLQINYHANTIYNYSFKQKKNLKYVSQIANAYNSATIVKKNHGQNLLRIDTQHFGLQPGKG